MKIRLEIKILKNMPIIYWLLLLFVPVEAISGMMANFSMGTINIIGYSYRGIIIIYYLRKFLKRTYVKFALMTALVLFGVICNGIIRQYGDFSGDILMFIRLLYFESLCLGIADDVLIGRLNIDNIEDILNKSAYIIIGIYALSIAFGSGLTSYADSGAGYKAFFNSINSLTCVLIVLSCFQLYLFLENNKKIHIALYLVLTSFLFLLGSKSGIFFWGIYLLFSLWPQLSMKYIKRIAFIIIFIPIGAYVFLNKFSTQFQDIIQRLMYFQSTSKNNLQFLLSGRNSLFVYALNEFNQNLHIFDIVFGKGASNMQMLIGHISNWGMLKNVEMDIFDIFFFYGVLGVMITYWLVVYFYKNSFKRGFDGKKVLFWICIVFSILGGHIFMDSFGSTILSLIVGLNLNVNLERQYKSERYSGK